MLQAGPRRLQLHLWVMAVAEESSLCTAQDCELLSLNASRMCMPLGSPAVEPHELYAT